LSINEIQEAGRREAFHSTDLSYHTRSQSQSQSYLTTDGQSANLFWCQVTIKSRDQFFVLLEIFFRQLGVCSFVAPSLTRGWVYNLLLLQALASVVPLWSGSRGTQDHILFPQPGGPGLHICIPQEQGGPDIPRALIPFSSPLTTRRATVEVFYPASTQVWHTELKDDRLILRRYIQTSWGGHVFYRRRETVPGLQVSFTRVSSMDL
jgi:hypothetical protein